MESFPVGPVTTSLGSDLVGYVAGGRARWGRTVVEDRGEGAQGLVKVCGRWVSKMGTDGCIGPRRRGTGRCRRWESVPCLETRRRRVTRDEGSRGGCRRSPIQIVQFYKIYIFV